MYVIYMVCMYVGQSRLVPSFPVVKDLCWVSAVMIAVLIAIVLGLGIAAFWFYTPKPAVSLYDNDKPRDSAGKSNGGVKNPDPVTLDSKTTNDHQSTKIGNNVSQQESVTNREEKENLGAESKLQERDDQEKRKLLDAEADREKAKALERELARKKEVERRAEERRKEEEIRRTKEVEEREAKKAAVEKAARELEAKEREAKEKEREAKEREAKEKVEKSQLRKELPGAEEPVSKIEIVRVSSHKQPRPQAQQSDVIARKISAAAAPAPAAAPGGPPLPWLAPPPAVRADPASERVRRLTWDTKTTSWLEDEIFLKIEARPFAKGAIREAYKCFNIDNPVAKISMTKGEKREVYEGDVVMSSVCEELALAFNSYDPPKPVHFLPAWLLEVFADHADPQLVDRPGRPLAGLEPYIAGDYRKYNNNSGVVLDDRNTPQAFSHFSYVQSKQEMIVVDIQGVQIHSIGKQQFGIGNTRAEGIKKFMASHNCNALCKSLGLPRIGRGDRKHKALEKKGTMFRPIGLTNKLGAASELAPEGDASEQYESGPAQLTPGLAPSFELPRRGPVTALAADAKFLYSGGEDGTLAIWELAEIEQPGASPVHEEKERQAIRQLIVDSEYLYEATDGGVIIREKGSWSLKKKLDTTARSVAVTTDYLISAGNDKLTTLWQRHSWMPVAEMEGHEKYIRCLAVAGDYALSGSNDNSIKMWDTVNKEFVFHLAAHKNTVRCLAVNGTTLLSGSDDKHLKSWDLTKLDLKADVKVGCFSHPQEHTGPLTSLTSAGNIALTTSEDGTFKIWRLDPLRCLGSYVANARGAADCACLSGRFVFVGSPQAKIQAWRLTS